MGPLGRNKGVIVQTITPTAAARAAFEASQGAVAGPSTSGSVVAHYIDDTLIASTAPESSRTLPAQDQVMEDFTDDEGKDLK
jgi:hypothetical protein